MKTRTMLGWMGVAVLVLAGAAGAQTTYYWVGANNANWSAAGSWSATSGGVAATEVPGASDTVIFNADGNTGAIVDASYDGAVGAVDIRSDYTGTLAGEGTIQANAAHRLEQSNGALASGGGGRVAVVLTNALADFTGFNLDNVAARGGTGQYAPSDHGGAGTIYLQTADQAANEGTLIVDNVTIDSSHRCVISDLVRDAAVGDVFIRNHARLHIDAAQTLTVRGDWNRTSPFTSAANGTVVFAGATPSTIWDDNTWGNLTIATAGKTVAFEAGKTQILTGTPTFENVVWLLSTGPGLPWYLVKPNGAGDEQPVGAVVVQDSDASAGKTFVAGLGSASLGNNRNWRFPPRRSLLTVQ